MTIVSAQKLEVWPVARLKPYSLNARTHDLEQVEKIAASIATYGFNNPILVDSEEGIVAGHGRLAAAQSLGLETVPVIVLDHLSDTQRRAYILADNRLAELAGWDDETLVGELEALNAEGVDLEGLGWTDEELEDLMDLYQELDPEDASEDADSVPEVPEEPITKPGDVWVLGKHRVMCGDSTNVQHVQRLMAGKTAALLHADPPYGMGKQSDGVANDNLYDEKLDEFQMEWWSTFRTVIDDNASAYIWGNAPELWRLWYQGGLGSSEKLELRNQIVWDKKNIAGMASDLLTQYPVASEHCLFFQLGHQFLGNVNAADFPETWEPLRAYLEAEAKAANIDQKTLRELCGVQMYGHWFTRSQFTLIPEKHYATLQAARAGRFQRPWRQLKAEWDRVKGGPTSEIQGARSYFNNGHDSMTDVWEFSRVTGEERHGHATPKPVDMMERIMRSSLPEKGLCVEPFGGSGSTLIAAQTTKRICYTMELKPEYCDVIVKRWEQLTGKKAELETASEEAGTL